MNENSNLQNTYVTPELIGYCVDPSKTQALQSLSFNEIRQILPFLTRIWHRSENYSHELQYTQFKLDIFAEIRKFEQTNNIISYLDADFSQIHDDVIRHLSTRKKSQAISQYSCHEFENATPTGKLLMISNILLNGNIRNDDHPGCKYCSIDYSLFDIDIYFDELSDILCIIHAELGEVISPCHLIFTLLHTQNSLNYILKLIANSIDSIFQIVDIIIDGCNCNAIDIQRHKCLMAVTQYCWNHLASYILFECSKRHYLPSVILYLAREEGLITVLLSILQFEYDRNWFVQFLRSVNKNYLEKQSVDMIREELVKSCYNCDSSATEIQLIKLYSALRVFAGLKFNEAESKALMDLIVRTKEISYAICFLLVYPTIFDQEANFQRIVTWLKQNFNLAQQNLFLIAIYCNTSQAQLLNDFVSNLLGYRMALKIISLQAMTRIFQQVFPDEMLINEYIKHLPVTKNLNAKTTLAQNDSSSTSLGIYFLNQLIKSNSVLNKRQLDLNNWLFEQILCCAAPLHSIIITLINNYVTQLFNPNIQNEFRLVPIEEEKILNFFKKYSTRNYDEEVAAKLLLFYYLLLYEEKRREMIHSNNTSTKISLKTNQYDSLLSFYYTTEVYDLINVTYLVLRAREPDYFIIYPPLIRLFTTFFPQFCQVQHSLFNSKFKNSKWENFDFMLFAMKSMKETFFNETLTRSLSNKIKNNWFQAYYIHGRKLSLQSASIILDMPKLKYEDTQSDPLILLRTNDTRVFRCGPMLEILLYIIKESLIVSKMNLEWFLLENHPTIAKDKSLVKAFRERDEFKYSYYATQDTAVIQTLLDIYLMIIKEANELERAEIRCIVCSFIHQMFIDNANLAEIIHFQGYSTSLIPVLVNGVPSMHICLDFLPKLLSHNDLDKQIFAIKLIAALCVKYPIVKSYNVAKLAINVAYTLMQSAPADQRRKLFNQIAPALVTLYTKLPPLTADCISLLYNAAQTKSLDMDSLPPLIDH